MTTVVAGDLSLSATGLAAWRDGRVFPPTTIKTLPKMPTEDRHHIIVMRLLAMAVGPTLYVLEGRIKPADEAVNTAMDLAELRGVVNYAIRQRGHTRADVNPLTLKVYATGNGRANKQAMVLAARGRLGKHAHVEDDNQADALWLLAMTLDHYGRPLVRLPTKNRDAAGRPPWPPFTLEQP